MYSGGFTPVFRSNILVLVSVKPRLRVGVVGELEALVHELELLCGYTAPPPQMISQSVGILVSFLVITATDRLVLSPHQKLLIATYVSICASLYGPSGLFLSIFSLWLWKLQQFLSTNDESDFMNYWTQLLTCRFTISALLIPTLGCLFDFIAGDKGLLLLSAIIMALVLMTHSSR